MNENELLRPMNAYEQQVDEEEQRRVESAIQAGAVGSMESTAANQQKIDDTLQRAEETKAMVDPETGQPKSTHELLDEKEFGLKENMQEAGNALVGGLQDAYNNTVTIGRGLDPDFWTSNDPYEYKGPGSQLVIDDNNMVLNRTVWGKILRNITEIGVGFLAGGAVGKALKGASMVLRGANTSAKAVQAGTAATNNAPWLLKSATEGVAVGAAVTAWDTDSYESSITEQLIDLKPEWFEGLKLTESLEDMTPAQRTALSMLESIGLDAGIGMAMGAFTRSMSKKAAEAGADAAKEMRKNAGLTEGVQEATARSADIDYKAKTAKVAEATEKKYSANQFQRLKKNGLIPKETTIDDWKATWKTPDKEAIDQIALEKFGSVTDENVQKVQEMIGPKWSDLDEAAQRTFMNQRAAEMNMDWGDTRDLTRKNVYKGEQAAEVAADQLELDLEINTPREGSFYQTGSAPWENQPLSHTTEPVKAVRDQMLIRGDRRYKNGSNRAPFTEAATRRMAEGTKGATTTKEMRAFAETLLDTESYRALYTGPSRQQVLDDIMDMAADVKEFLEPGPNSRKVDLSEGAIKDFIYSFDADNVTQIEGIRVMNTAQLTASDVMMGQMTQQIRDLAKVSLSVDEAIDTSVRGGMLDTMIARYKTLARMRAETSALNSYNLRRMRSGTKADANPKNVEAAIKEASDAAADRIETLARVIREDTDGSLFDAFRYFSAASNGKAMTFKDMEAFFADKLNGYSRGTQHQKNAIIAELQSMGINSMLSGPKTQARVLFGNAIGTTVKPVSAMVGAGVTGDARTFRSSAAAVGAMLDAIPEAWSKAVADFQTFTSRQVGDTRGLKMTGKDEEFEAMANFFKTQGKDSEKMAFGFASWLRALNKNPFLNYGPRLMQAQDTFFGQLIGRGRARQKAFLEVYDGIGMNQSTVSSSDLKTAVRLGEKKFAADIWTSDGHLADSMAEFSRQEATMTKELPAWAKDIEAFTDKAPMIKPFVGLFMKTGINAVEMTAKHTPIVNRVLKESRDIMSKAWDDPVMIQYGIKSPDDLAIAKATLRGREAIGMGFVSMAGMLWLNGNLTGSGPPDRKLREAWMQTGAWQPRSLKIGNVWVSYESLEPYNSLLNLIADIGDATNTMGEAWATDHYAKIGHVLSSNLTNKTFLAGLMNLGDLLSGKGQRAEAVAANIVNNQIPLSSLRNEIGKLLNPGMRELEGGFMQSIRNRNLWSEFMVDEEGRLPYRYDIFDGTPLKDWDPMQRAVNALLPFNINTDTNSTRELLFRSQVNLAQQFNTAPDGTSLEGYPELKSKFNYLMSQQGLEVSFEKLFQDPEIVRSIIEAENSFAQGNGFNTRDTVHGNQILKILRAAKTVAWEQLMEEDINAATLAEQQAIKKREAKLRKSGDSARANELDNIQKILAIPK